MIKVLIADDHTIVRRGIMQIIDEAPEIVTAGEASSGSEVLQAVREGYYDVLLLDINLPDRSGLEILKHLLMIKPALNVLMLSIYPEEQYAVRALKAGAKGYLTKESAPDELIADIRKVSQGWKYVTSSLAERLASELVGDVERKPHETLSDREFQVLRMLATGKAVTKIAAELSLSAKTISTYRTRILENLDLKNTVEIVRYAIQHGLVD